MRLKRTIKQILMHFIMFMEVVIKQGSLNKMHKDMIWEIYRLCDLALSEIEYRENKKHEN